MPTITGVPKMGREELRSHVVRLVTFTHILEKDFQDPNLMNGLPQEVKNDGTVAVTALFRARDQLLKVLEGLIAYENS